MTLNELLTGGQNNVLATWEAKLAAATTWEELMGRDNPHGYPQRIGQDPQFPFVMGVTTDGKRYRFDEYVKGSTPHGQPDWCGTYMRKGDGEHIIVKSVNGTVVTTTQRGEWRENFAEYW